MERLAFDIEVYRNYFLVMFRNITTGNVIAFEKFEGQPLDTHSVLMNLRRRCTVGFNSINFDFPVLFGALAGKSNSELKDISDSIIVTGLKPWHVENKFGFKIEKSLNHIDLIEVAPGKAGLKLYGGRIHTKKLQDLPIDPSAMISPEDREVLKMYCGNDLTLTEELHNYLLPQIELREKMSKEYDIDLRSKSDAQIAEAVIKSQIRKLTKSLPERPVIEQGTAYKYKAPAFIKFKSKILQDTLKMVESSDFIVISGGKLDMPSDLKSHIIKMGSSEYRMGMGGLHSCEESVSHVSDELGQLYDRDVVSYYPAIILRCKLFPEHIGEEFLSVYKAIVDRRIEAKKTGNKVVADALKITVNGSFGKLGSMWSALYAPNLLIQTTLTGQLSLLMLIEMFEARGITVLSANTDGVVFKTKDEDLAKSIVKEWELATGFETEETKYKALYSRDINNYIAIKPDGTAKLKGAYTSGGLQKNPANEIVSEAVVAFLSKNIPVEETIKNCKELRKFITIRTVQGGATYDGGYLGKVVRWYYGTTSKCPIHYKVNGHLVPRSTGAVPCMDLPDEFPADINYDWYITEARSVLADIGWKEIGDGGV